ASLSKGYGADERLGLGPSANPFERKRRDALPNDPHRLLRLQNAEEAIPIAFGRGLAQRRACFVWATCSILCPPG
ncbi:unnamed protein product, partial [Musa hybrid cultivar]